MYEREIRPELQALAKQYPVVTVIGPRQSGKTTLVRQVFPKKPYHNLESPDTLQVVRTDPRGFLRKHPDGAILDEVQRAPELLSYIQVIVDEAGINGMFVLTGSHQMSLHEAISQSLAGRTALLTLLPMSLGELERAGINQSIDESLLTGGYPRIFREKLAPTQAYRNYLKTYVERDLREMIHLHDLTQFQRFLQLCAGRIGQILNMESLGNDVGVSSHTIKHWLSILEASHIVIRLQPYFENFGKRVIKSPKLYFTDVGFATFLLGIESIVQVERNPLRGNLVENLILLELMKSRLSRGLDPRLYYFRDAHGHEVDFIYQSAYDLIPIEVKASATFNKDFLKNLRFFQNLVKERAPKGYVVYTGDLQQQMQTFELLPYRQAPRIVQSPDTMFTL